MTDIKRVTKNDGPEADSSKKWYMYHMPKLYQMNTKLP